jgi:hypothetical protein
MRFSQHLQSLAKASLRHLVYSNVYIALLAVAALWQASVLLQTTLSGPLIGLVFFATLAHYNLDRLLEYQQFAKSTQVRLQWLQQRKGALALFTGLSGAAAAYCLSLQTTAVIRWVALLVMVAVGYSLFFGGFKKQGVLSWAGIFKPLLIGFVWMGMGPALLLIHLQEPLTTQLPWLLSQLLFIAALCLPFDWRDRQQDQQKDIQSLALLLSERHFGWLILALLLLHWVLFNFSFPAFAMLLLPGTAFSMGLCLYSLRRKKEWLYVFGIDGLIGLQAISIGLQHLVL